jgi:hypothetical protein
MPRRKRKHIPIIQIAASALADKLPQHVRDLMREGKAPAKKILSMFTPDHVQLHCWGGRDSWWNLDMRMRDASLKAKDAADTARAAKAIRVSEKHQEFRKRLLSVKKRKKPKSRWASRPLQSRGFEKRA